MQPLVTVITPTYNAVKFLEQTVESVVGQDYSNVQYIVLNDGSTDGTNVLLRELSYRFPAMRFYSHTNMGEQKTVNRGLEMVKGKYFMVVNADDPLLPGAISTLVEFMEQHPNILCAYPDYDVIGENGETRMHVKTREYDFSWMVRHHTCIPSVGSMFRSSVIQSVGLRDTSYKWLGDFDYWLRVGLQGDMCRVPKTLATWRHRDGQLSGDKSDARAEEHIDIMGVEGGEFWENGVARWHGGFFGQDVPQEIFDIRQEAWCWSYLVAASVCQSKRKVVEYLTKAIESYPRMFLSPEFYDVARHRLAYILRR